MHHFWCKSFAWSLLYKTWVCIKWNSKVASGLSRTSETGLGLILNKIQETIDGLEALKYLI